MRLLQFLYLIGGVYVSGSDGPISNDTQLGTHLTHKKLHGPRQTAIMMENVVAASAQSQAHTKNTLYHLRAWLLPNQKTLWSLDTINGRSLNGSYVRLHHDQRFKSLPLLSVESSEAVRGRINSHQYQLSAPSYNSNPVQLKTVDVPRRLRTPETLSMGFVSFQPTSTAGAGFVVKDGKLISRDRGWANWLACPTPETLETGRMNPSMLFYRRKGSHTSMGCVAIELRVTEVESTFDSQLKFYLLVVSTVAGFLLVGYLIMGILRARPNAPRVHDAALGDRGRLRSRGG